MAEMIRRRRTRSESEVRWAASSARRQSMAVSSAIASASDSLNPSSSATTNFVAEAQERAPDGEAGRAGCGLLQDQRELLVAIPELDAPDDGFAIGCSQTYQRGFVAP